MTKMSKDRRYVLRLALYIEVMGSVPSVYGGQPLSAYAIVLQQQYQALRHDLGPEASAAARGAGRELIRTKGFPEIQKMFACLLSPVYRQPDGGTHEGTSVIYRAVTSEAEKERLLRKGRLNCRRKLRHLDYLTALLHARRLEEQDLNIYPCSICGGLHVGHRPDAVAQRRRFIVKELKSLDRRTREIEQSYAGLVDRRKNLAAELETMEATDLP
jgi:hypothetical protein